MTKEKILVKKNHNSQVNGSFFLLLNKEYMFSHCNNINKHL